MARKKKQEYLGGGIRVTLQKDYTEYGITRPAGTQLIVSASGYRKLLEGGYLEQKNKIEQSKK